MQQEFNSGDTVLFDAGSYGAAVGVVRGVEDDEDWYHLYILQSTHDDFEVGKAQSVPMQNDNLYPVPAPVCLERGSVPQT